MYIEREKSDVDGEWNYSLSIVHNRSSNVYIILEISRLWVTGWVYNDILRYTLDTRKRIYGKYGRIFEVM